MSKYFHHHLLNKVGNTIHTVLSRHESNNFFSKSCGFEDKLCQSHSMQTIALLIPCLTVGHSCSLFILHVSEYSWTNTSKQNPSQIATPKSRGSTELQCVRTHTNMPFELPNNLQPGRRSGPSVARHVPGLLPLDPRGPPAVGAHGHHEGHGGAGQAHGQFPARDREGQGLRGDLP